MTGLENLLAEVLMSALSPCDLGDGIEVVHDVEAVEIEMDCSVDDDDDAVELLGNTTKFAREELGTHRFVRYSAPYERIEVQLDANAFLRATIEEAKSLIGGGEKA